MARRRQEPDVAESPVDQASKRTTAKVRPASTARRHQTSGARRVTHAKKSSSPGGQTSKTARRVDGSPQIEEVQQRVERIEAGMRIMAQTFKRAFDDLDAAIERLRADVALTATPADVERAVARSASPTDVAHAAARAMAPLRTALDRLAQTGPPPSAAALQAAMSRLREGIEDVQAMVEDSLTTARVEGSATPEPSSNGNSGPDPSTIWGEEGGEAAEVFEQWAPDRRSAARRWFDRSRPGRAYADWKLRRT